MTTPEQFAAYRDNADIGGTAEQLRVAIRTLPEWHGAAKLCGIADRVADAVQDHPELERQTRRLVAASREILDADPYVEVDRLARRLLEMCEAVSVNHTPESLSCRNDQ